MPGARVYQFSVDKKMDGYIYLRYLDIADGGLVAKYPGVFVEKVKSMLTVSQKYTNELSRTIAYSLGLDI